MVFGKISSMDQQDLLDTDTVVGPVSSWRRLAWSLTLVALILVPLIFLPFTPYPVTLTQQTLALILISFAVALAVVGAIAQGGLVLPTVLIRPSLIRLPLWLLLAVCSLAVLISLLLAPARLNAFWGVHGGEPDSFVNLLTVLAMFLLVALLATERGTVQAVVPAVTATITVALLFFLFNNLALAFLSRSLFAFMAVPGFSPLGVLGSLAGFFGLGIVLLLVYGAFHDDTQPRSRGWAVLLILLFLALLVIAHRPTFIALALTLTLALAANLVRQRSMPLARFNLVVFFISVSVIFLAVRLPITGLLNLPVEVSLTHSASAKIITRTLFESPGTFFFGAGPVSFVNQYNQYTPRDINATAFWNFEFRQPTSFWLDALSAFGVIGGLALLLFVLSLVLLGLREGVGGDSISVTSGVPQSLAIGVTYLAILGCFYSFNFVTLLVFAALLGGLVAEIALRHQELTIVPLTRVNAKNVFVSLCLIALLIGSILIGIFATKRYVAYVMFNRVVTAYNVSGNVDEAIPALGRAYALQASPEFAQTLSALWFEKLRRSFSEATAAGSVQTRRPQLQQAAENAIAAMQIAVSLDPHSAQRWNSLGSVYEQILPIARDAHQAATANYQRAHELSPENPSFLLSLARVQLFVADNGLADRTAALQKAEQYLNQALERKPDYDDAYLALAQVYDRSGRTAEAITKISTAIGASPQNVGLRFQLGYLYYQRGDYAGARDALSAAVILAPNQANARYFLGLAYNRLGERDAAIEQFGTLLQLNPNNTDILRILNNLRSGKPAL